MGWTGMLRVAGLYLAGVGMGCLGASVAEPKKYLLGASAGVYALIFAHLGTYTGSRVKTNAKIIFNQLFHLLRFQEFA